MDFPQPCRMRRLVRVLKTPSEFLLCSFALVKVARKLRSHDTGDPVHDENLAARKLLCLIEGGNRVFYISVALQKWHRGGMLSAQKADDCQVRRLLNLCQLRLKFLETRAVEFRSFILQVRVRKL